MSETLGFPNELVSLMATMSKNQAVLNTVAKNAALRDPAASIKALIEAGAKVDYDELVTALAPLTDVFKEVLPLAIAKNPTYDFIRSAIKNGLPASALIPVVADGKRTTLKIPQLLARDQQWSVLLRLLDDKVFTLQGCGLVLSQLLQHVDCSAADLSTPFKVMNHFGGVFGGLYKTPLATWVEKNRGNLDAMVVEMMSQKDNGFCRAAAWAAEETDVALMVYAAHDDSHWVTNRAEKFETKWFNGLSSTLQQVLHHTEIGDSFLLALAKTTSFTATVCKDLLATAKLYKRETAVLLEAVEKHIANKEGMLSSIMSDAIAQGDSALLAGIIKAGGDKIIVVNNTFLFDAMVKQQATCVEALVKGKADVTSCDRTGWSPLQALGQWSCEEGVGEAAREEYSSMKSAVRDLLTQAGAK